MISSCSRSKIPSPEPKKDLNELFDQEGNRKEAFSQHLFVPALNNFSINDLWNDYLLLHWRKENDHFIVPRIHTYFETSYGKAKEIFLQIFSLVFSFIAVNRAFLQPYPKGRLVPFSIGIFSLKLSIDQFYRGKRYQVLTGNEIRVELKEPISEKTRENILIAKTIISITADIESSNYLERNKNTQSLNEREQYKKLINIWNEISSIRSHFMLKKLASPSHRYEYFGNCGELVDYGIIHLRKNFPEFKNTPVQRADLPEIDHTFIVIGENPGLLGPNTKNHETILCDPWTRSFFPSREFYKHIHGFSGMLPMNGKIRTCVTSFDEETLNHLSSKNV